MKYEWKKGAHTKGIEAEKVGRALEQIRKKNGGTITADLVLAAARRESSPLHAWFEWDDTAAARQYRLEQARGLIRSVVVRIVGDEKDERVVRAFVNLGEGPEYEEIHSVLASVDRRALMLDRAFRELERIRKEFGDFEELAGIFAAIDEARAVAA